MHERIISWSFSKLQDFEKCKFAAKLKHLDKVPEPERKLRPGQTEHANDRGSRIHDNCEFYVRGEIDDLCLEAQKHFHWKIDLLRDLYTQGLVELEGNWATNEDWEVAEWSKGWQRLKLDALVRWSPEQATVIDYKSGRKFGNEVKHAQQLQLYALNTFLRYPELDEIDAELWYIDIGEVTVQRYTRDQALRFRSSFDRRGHALTDCIEFTPNPNKWSCQWCLYGPEHSGHCSVGVRKGG